MKSNRIIELTQAVERKYGSIMNAPYNCPELAETHMLLGSDKKSPNRTSQEVCNRIIALINYGYSIKNVRTICGVSKNVVYKVIHRNNLTIK